MKNSLQKIMNGLIDYAGLFPPAKLPLDQAITEYISHFSDQKKWMLGRFIIPISQLNDLEKFIPKFDNVGTLKLSVLGAQSTSDKEFLEQTKKELSIIKNFESDTIRDRVYFDLFRQIHLLERYLSLDNDHICTSILNFNKPFLKN